MSCDKDCDHHHEHVKCSLKCGKRARVHPMVYVWPGAIHPLLRSLDNATIFELGKLPLCIDCSRNVTTQFIIDETELRDMALLHFRTHEVSGPDLSPERMTVTMRKMRR